MAVLTPELSDFDSFAVRRRSKAPTSEVRFFPLETGLLSYSKGIEQLDTHLAVSRC